MQDSSPDTMAPVHDTGICTSSWKATQPSMHHVVMQSHTLQRTNKTRSKHSFSAAQDAADDRFVYSNLRDGRVQVFWLLQLANQLATILCIGILVYLARIPVLSNVSTINIAPPAETWPASLAADTWASLNLSTTVDSIMVLATFNGPVIRRFHYSVSQRIMFLASTLSLTLFLSHERGTLVTRNLIGSMAVTCVPYTFFCFLLDHLETKFQPSGPDCGWRDFSQYSKSFLTAQSSWGRALMHSVVIAVAGLSLTMLIPAPWSCMIPVVNILFEVMYRWLLKIKKTPQLILLVSPPLFANVCVHWGLAPLLAWPQISIPPWSFLALFLAGRIILDIHLQTVLKWRHELHWSRREVLFSTRQLLGICAAMLLLETLGLKIVTYVKLIIIPAVLGVASIGFSWLAAHNIAVRVSTT